MGVRLHKMIQRIRDVGLDMPSIADKHRTYAMERGSAVAQTQFGCAHIQAEKPATVPVPRSQAGVHDFSLDSHHSGAIFRALS